MFAAMEPLRSYEPETDTCADRRASRRVRVTCPATLQTMTTMTEGILGDISETGARFEADEPPGKGATAVLKWGKHEAVCTIIWHDEGSCGVWFKQPLSAEIVAETAALDRVIEIPIASVGNITQGRKRSMGFLKRAVPEEDVAVPPPPPATQLRPVVVVEQVEPKQEFVPEVDPLSEVGDAIDDSDLSKSDGDAVPALAEAPVVPILKSIFLEPLFDGHEEEGVVECPAEPETGADEAPLTLEPPPPLPAPVAEEEPAFGRAAGLPPPSIGHSETLAEVLRRYRQGEPWERGLRSS